MKTAYQRFCKWKKRNPLKRKANQIIFVEKRAGRIKPEPCIICGKEETQSHHEDYNRPYDIVWLCKKCHCQRHLDLGSYKSCGGCG